GAEVGGRRSRPTYLGSRRGWLLLDVLLLVVLLAEVRDLLLAHEPAERVLELRLLDEQVVLRVDRRRVLRALEVEREPLLDALEPRPVGEVHEQRQVEDDRRREDRVAAEEVDLDLHRVAEPPEDVDVVPAL